MANVCDEPGCVAKRNAYKSAEKKAKRTSGLSVDLCKESNRLAAVAAAAAVIAGAAAKAALGTATTGVGIFVAIGLAVIAGAAAGVAIAAGIAATKAQIAYNKANRKCREAGIAASDAHDAMVAACEGKTCEKYETFPCSC